MEEAGGDYALVMELTEGTTLAERIAAGPLPLDDAVAIARQVLDALETAHERGIVHRDLKPANINIAPDGTVKVLDFGVAKALDTSSGGMSTPAGGATVTSPALTAMGLILGTAAYMAPEQARGRLVDRRCDLWAFGCVLYEMLTGTRGFGGDDVTETLASVLKSDIRLGELPATVPPRVRQVIAACLQKDPRGRLASASDARLLLDGAFDEPSSTWGRTGELYYRSPQGDQMMAVKITTTPTLTVGTPVRLFQGTFYLSPATGSPRPQYDVTADGERFLMLQRDRTMKETIVVVQNWFEELRQLLPGNDGGAERVTGPTVRRSTASIH